MAVNTLNFAAQVGEWVAQSQARLLAVFHQSAQDVIAHMQTPLAAGGNMPVDTGFLRASLQVSTNGPVPLSKANPGTKHTYEPTVAVLAIAGAQIGQTIYATYTANYAGYVNYGTNGRQGRHFVDMAAQRWPQIVQANAEKLQALSQGSK